MKDGSGFRELRSRAEGMALILVILVLSALVLVGTPFILSMKLQERGSVNTLAQTRADLAAVSARNHAVAHLMESHPSRERDAGVAEGEVPGYVWDALEDFDVPMPAELTIAPFDPSGTAFPEGDDPAEEDEDGPVYVMRGSDDRIIDVRVEDEQGKVNINSAYPNLVGNLLGGSALATSIGIQDDVHELQLIDTTPFPADDDPDTVDGVVVILNPALLTFEAVSYRGKTDEALTGCFRGEYLSAPLRHEAGFPVFDIRGMKVFLHRNYNLADGELRTFRTPQSIREVADWSVVPYFLENLALLGLNVRNMKEFGLTPQLLARAGLDAAIMERNDDEVDNKVYAEAKKTLREAKIPDDLVRMLENFRGKSGVVQAAELATKYKLEDLELNAIASGAEMFKGQLKEVQKRTQKYFPKAIEAYKEIAEVPGLETFTAEDFELIRDLITTTSSIPAEWSPEQVVIGPIQVNPIVGFPALKVLRTDWFNPGTLVRVRSNRDPSKVEYQLAAFGNPNSAGGRRGGSGGGSIRNIGAQFFQGGILLKGPLRFAYEEGEAVVAALMRHPINVNTAPRAVLEAVFTGVRSMRSGRRGGGVSPEEARKLVERLFDNMPIVSFEHFRGILTEAATDEVFESRHLHALILNAINPNHYQLSVSTTGLCYGSGDVYTIEATGKINNPAGVELASSRTREVVEVAPPDPLRYVLDTQNDWAFRLFADVTGDRRRWSRGGSVQLPGSRGHLMVTGPRPLFFDTSGQRFVPPALDRGSLSSLTAELESNDTPPITSPDPQTGQPTQHRITWGDPEHFRDTIEGRELTGAHTMSTEQQSSSGAPVFLETLPGVVEFWVKPNWQSRTADRTFFDILPDPSFPRRNRVRLYFAGDTQELVFEIHDNTLLEVGPPGSVPAAMQTRAPAEIRHPINPQTFANDTWYHIACCWSSTTPGDQTLLIDGRPVGKNTWVTRLLSPLNVSGRMSLEAAIFPATCALLVGTEVVEIVDGAIVKRGARGSVRQIHPAGTPVRLFGYSVDLTTANPSMDMNFHDTIVYRQQATSGIDLINDKGIAAPAQVMVMGPGGARLAERLPPAKSPTSFGLPGGQTTTTWEVSQYPQLDIVEITDTYVKVRQDPAEAGFQSQGYICLIGFRNNQDLLHEYIFYDRWVVEGTEFVFNAIVRNAIPSALNAPFAADKLLYEEILPGLAAPQIVHWAYGASVRADINLESTYPKSGGVIQLASVARDPDTEIPPETPLDFLSEEWVVYDRVQGTFFIAPHPFLGRGFRGFTGDRYNGNGDSTYLGAFRWQQFAVADHLARAEAIPVWRVTRPFLGVGDSVGISESIGATPGTPGNVELRPLRVAKVIDANTGTYFSLFPTQPQNAYLLGTMPKLQKFPSGDLPTIPTGQISFGAPGGPGAGGGQLEATIDEIRLSRSTVPDADLSAFPIPGGRRLTTYDLPRSSGQSATISMKAILTAYGAQADPGAGGKVDKVLLLGQRRMRPLYDSAGTFHGRGYTNGSPASYGVGKREGLLFHDDEVFHYDIDPQNVNPPAIFLAQDYLRADQYEVEDFAAVRRGEWNPIDPRRELRAEVVPSIQVTGTAGLPRYDGFLEIVDSPTKEVIYYQSASGGFLQNVLRGQLGTHVGSYRRRVDINGNTISPRFRLIPRQEVEMRARGMLDTERQVGVLGAQGLLPLTHIGVTRTTGVMTYTDIPVVSTQGFGSLPGYLRIDDGDPLSPDEIIAHIGKSGGSFRRARDSRTLQGILRGRFGTEYDGNISADLTLIEFPVRYHDHYQAEVDSPDLQFFERHLRVPGATWDRITWQEREERNRTFRTEVRVLARLDGIPDWDAKPTNEPGGLYLFTDPDKPNRVAQQADLIEFRVMFRYLPGSYGRNASGLGGGWSDDWKHAPTVDTLTVEYRKPWRVVHREDLPF